MLDNTDIHILDELSKNSRITMKELGGKVHLTGPATSARVAKLEESGVIEGYTINLNRVKLGYHIHAFLTIITDSIFHKSYLSFVETQKQYLINNYKISGDGCYILECNFPSIELMNLFLEELNKHANYKLSIVINK
ncbi:Lrp/AsnC family transcriptional regulator (plasmid) [Ureibacillus chungkukjangi]|uniref:Lrp/AsnC family transcriptional regulator n=1 Tax=Ureibacillus chungkukjangi TaxID=1202712 RepID=UPI000D3C3354|nr:Lrp/AsnC family transcriptional regulator [Ureibacillus chungkukjangi]MCM3390467.1 Lrp/AsnC family transcriptional regulator [Ureibacillus chungkukjangi]